MDGAYRAASHQKRCRLFALSPPKAAEEPDTARTDESGSKVDWEESEHVVDWVLGAA